MEDPKLPIELSVAQREITELRARVAELEAEVTGYREWGEDVKRLTRQIDVEMHGEEGAARQASLCDLVGPAKELRVRAEAAEAELARRGQGVQVKPELAAIADSLDAWADVLRDGRQIDGSITGLRSMARTIRTALVSPGDGWGPPPEDQRPEGYRCLALVEVAWTKDAFGSLDWRRPDDQWMYRIAEGAPGTHGFLPLPAPPASEGA